MPEELLEQLFGLPVGSKPPVENGSLILHLKLVRPPLFVTSFVVMSIDNVSEKGVRIGIPRVSGTNSFAEIRLAKRKFAGGMLRNVSENGEPMQAIGRAKQNANALGVKNSG